MNKHSGNTIHRACHLAMVATLLLVALLSTSSHAQIKPEPDKTTEPAMFIYWTQPFQGILRATLDGEDEQNVVTTGPLSFPYDIVLDRAGGRMYWTVLTPDEEVIIQHANWDGSDMQNISVGLVEPGQIALDTAGGKLYWVETAGGTIGRANFDGSAAEDVITEVEASSVALDTAGGKLYRTEPKTRKIRRSNLDGSEAEDLVTSDELGSPFDIALDVAGGKMYWAYLEGDIISGTPTGGKIQRANLDGSQVEVLANTSVGVPWDIALDIAGGKMYWSYLEWDAGADFPFQNGKIQRANFDGSEVEDIVTGLQFPTFGIALGIPPQLPPGEKDVVAADSDSGDTLETATDLSFDTPHTEDISPSGDVDYFSIQVDQTGELTIYTTGDLDTVGELQDSSGAGIAENDDGGSEFNFRIVYDVLSPRTYYVKIEGFWGVAGSYTVYTEFSAGLSADVNDDGVVDLLDLIQIGENYGQTGENDADANGDGVVDIVDLVMVAGAFEGDLPAAPPVFTPAVTTLNATDVQKWLADARRLMLTDSTSQRGVLFLEHLLMILTPAETVLLPNYPNPFNPETWIPYQLTHDADVSLAIYDTNGAMVRLINLGHQPAGFYTERSRAAHWDGRNDSGETVASGMYFYRLRAGDYSHMRRMVIVK